MPSPVSYYTRGVPPFGGYGNQRLLKLPSAGVYYCREVTSSVGYGNQISNNGIFNITCSQEAACEAITWKQSVRFSFGTDLQNPPSVTFFLRLAASFIVTRKDNHRVLRSLNSILTPPLGMLSNPHLVSSTAVYIKNYRCGKH